MLVATFILHFLVIYVLSVLCSSSRLLGIAALVLARSVCPYNYFVICRPWLISLIPQFAPSSARPSFLFRVPSLLCSVKMPKESTRRSRAWCITINNPDDLDGSRLQASDYKYLVIGNEVGESGTPHLQCYVYFPEKLSRRAVSKLAPRGFLQPAEGTPQQASDYCKKDGDYKEYGELPMSQSEKGVAGAKAWAVIIAHARVGDEDWLLENYPKVYFSSLSTFRSHRAPVTTILDHSDDDSPNIWLMGATGTGKSRWLFETYPNHFRKEWNKWWGGYRGQDTVAIEEASPEVCKLGGSKLKLWADRYPFEGEVKNGHLASSRPARIIVTSNYSIEECYPAPQDYEPLKRRFKVMVMGSDGVPIPFVQSSVVRAWHSSYRSP